MSSKAAGFPAYCGCKCEHKLHRISASPSPYIVDLQIQYVQNANRANMSKNHVAFPVYCGFIDTKCTKYKLCEMSQKKTRRLPRILRISRYKMLKIVKNIRK